MKRLTLLERVNREGAVVVLLLEGIEVQLQLPQSICSKISRAVKSGSKRHIYQQLINRRLERRIGSKLEE
jgi:hypothetical protein